MPSHSSKQKKFFQAVKAAKHNPNAPVHLKKVADSISDKDIDDFVKQEGEFKVKKAVLGILKDIVEPMYLNEEEEGVTGDTSLDPVANTFHVKAEWATYIKPYIGQPFSPKELDAINNFKEKKPTTIARTEIWYKTTDSFAISHTTVIKKMKDSGQFSFTAFSKQEKIQPDEEKNQDQTPSAGEIPPQSPTAPGGSNPPTDDQNNPSSPDEDEKDDIIVTKSILFRDDIKGAGILISFLKKLDL